MIETTIGYYDFIFETDEECFSPKAIDKGTLAMLSHIRFAPGEKVLDLGCGYGVVGIAAAKYCGAENVYMTDINPVAVECTRRNILLNHVAGIHVFIGDAYDNVDESGFDMIICNPPYHADFSVPKKFIEKGFNRLKLGGRMYMVTKRRDWYKNKLISIFGGVSIDESNGYYIFEAEKRKARYSSRADQFPNNAT